MADDLEVAEGILDAHDADWETFMYGNGRPLSRESMERCRAALRDAIVSALRAAREGDAWQPMRDALTDGRLADAVKALREIDQWSRAYPLDVFPEPDWAKVRQLLESGGITLAAVSASNMRHVIEGVGKIARAALNPKTEAG